VADVQRRRSVRYPTDLPVKYRFHSTDPWRDRRIIDVSERGAAVELLEVEPGESSGRRLDIEISSVVPEADGVIIHSAVRHHNRRPGGALVVGVEFTHAGSTCGDSLRLLLGLHAFAVAGSSGKHAEARSARF
jgi:hypothetical protein